MAKEKKEVIPGISIEDIMKEVGSMASGNATIALSDFFTKNKEVKKNLFNKDIEIMPVSINYIDLKDLSDYLNSERIGIGYNVKFNMLDSSGNTLIFFPRRSSLLIPMLIRGKYDKKEEFIDVLFDEDISTILLICSTISKSYVNTLKEFLEVDIDEKYANLVMMLEKDVEKFFTGELESNNAKIISVEVNFNIKETEFSGALYFMLVLKDIEGFINIIKKKWGVC